MGRRDHALAGAAKGTQRSTWKIAVYIRLSKEDGNDVSYSVINQKALILKYIEQVKAEEEEEYTIVDFYTDDGLTGTDDSREEFQRMLRDIERKRVNCIIVKDLSRPFRNYADQGYYLECFFPLHDVRFISLQLPFLDSYLYPETMQSIAVPMQGVVNDNHCRETSIKVRQVFNYKRSQGQFIGAFAPYGYQKDPNNKNKLIVDEQAAAVVRDIYRWFVMEGMSKMAIAKRLSSQGTLNPASYKRANGLKYENPNNHFDCTLWSAATVTRILKNPTYLGHMVQGRQKVKSYKVHHRVAVPEDDWFLVQNTHEPIISQELFDKAQSLHARDTRTAPQKKELYLFSGFLRCADCQKAMHRKKYGKYGYYVCRTYKEHSDLVCSKHTIREKDLIKAVLKMIQIQIQLVDSMAKMIQKINNSPVVQLQPNRIADNLKNRERELEKATRLKDSLYESWQNGDISREDYSRMKAKYEEQLEQLGQTMQSLRKEQETLFGGVSPDHPDLQHFIKYNNIEELDRGLLIELVDTIFVHENQGITIQFKYADPYQRAVEFIEKNKNLLN